MRIISREEIEAILPSLDLTRAIEEGFVAYSSGQAEVPPVGELLLEKWDVHIKYGYIRQDDFYVIKIASGFYENPTIGLTSGNGLMLLFSQETGEPKGILLDEGYLTDTRTAVAGAVVAKYLAPHKIECIGIVGTGTQAHLQVSYLKSVTSCRQVLVWGRGEDQLARYRQDMETHDFIIETTRSTADILRACNLIVTATPATEPLLTVTDLQAGTHITAIGSDTPYKQELDPAILRDADVVVADSIQQCLVRGEVHKAIRAGYLVQEELVELGDIIAGHTTGRTSDDQVTVADLTGVAVQDIKIATAIYNAVE